VIDPRVVHVVLGVLIGWLDRREGKAIAYLIEENGSCAVRLADVDCV
jgi:hypothetical protein